MLVTTSHPHSANLDSLIPYCESLARHQRQPSPGPASSTPIYVVQRKKVACICMPSVPGRWAVYQYGARSWVLDRKQSRPSFSTSTSTWA